MNECGYCYDKGWYTKQKSPDSYEIIDCVCDKGRERLEEAQDKMIDMEMCEMLGK